MYCTWCTFVMLSCPPYLSLFLACLKTVNKLSSVIIIQICVVQVIVYQHATKLAVHTRTVFQLSTQCTIGCQIKNKNKSLYLSVNVFSTAVLIEDTVNSETNIINQTETC